MNFKNIMKHKKRNIILILVFLISLITLFWYSFVFEPNNIQVEKINIKIENLPEEFEGTKIVHLTDFHSKNFGEREKKVLEILDDINPDFVFITGDFIDHKTKDIDSCQEFWRELGNKYQGKIFGVLGNHEYWNNDAGSEFLKSLLNESGVVVLDNKNEKIFQGDEYIYLIGVGDPHTGNDNLEKAVTGVEKDIPKILLAHSPDIVNNSEDIEKEKVDLILVGHTHGGQVKIPFLRPFWTPTENRGKYASGLFEINDTYLYVNRGIGTTVLPIRFNCSLEVTMIELRKK